MLTVATFNAGNLMAVAEEHRRRYPNRLIFAAGDDDKKRGAELDEQRQPKVNVDRVKAEETAAAISGHAVFPTFPAGTPGTDWNDLAQAIGRRRATGQIEVALAIGKREQTVLSLSAARDVAEDRGQE